MNRPHALSALLALAAAQMACTTSERPIGDRADGAGGAPLAPFVPYAPPTASTTPTTGAGAPLATSGGGPAGGAGETPPASTACASTAAAPGTMPGRTPLSLGDAGTRAVAPRAISGGTLLVTRDGGAALASDPDRDVVSIVDVGARTVRKQVALTPGDEPGRLVEDAAGRVHVALRSGGAFATIDPNDGTLVRRVQTCPAPRGIAYDAAGDLVYVACADGHLQSFDAPTGGFRRDVVLERDLRDVVALGDGRIVVSTFRRADTIVVAADGTIAARSRPAPRARKGPTGLQMMSPAVAWRMTPVSGGGAIMLHQRGVDDEVAPSPGGYGAGPSCSSIVESAVTIVAPGDAPAPTPGIALATLAVDVALSPDGQRIAVAAPGNAGTPLPQVVVAPTAQATDSSSDCAMPSGAAIGTSDDQIVAVAFDAAGSLVAQSREPAALVFADGGRVPLAVDSVSDTGHTIFHANAGAGIACASCHPEGGDDARTWRFACLGPRRTQVIRGGISGTEPFHWDGDMKDFGSLVHAVFEGRMSGPSLSDAQSSALLRWVDALPALPNPTTRTDAVARGDALFHDAVVGCSSCHSGAKLTNNLTVDVGLGHATQVPSLRGVVWRAPYLHTGCAQTLRDRFDPACGGAKHGQTSQLSSDAVDDLVAYLETL